MADYKLTELMTIRSAVAARSSMILPSEDLAETIASFMEKRKPAYKRI
jgi:hypothetical protein